MCDHTKIFVIVESELIFRIQGLFCFFSSWDMMQGYEIGFRVSEKSLCCVRARVCFNLRDQKN